MDNDFLFINLTKTSSKMFLIQTKSNQNANNTTNEYRALLTIIRYLQNILFVLLCLKAPAESYFVPRAEKIMLD